MSQPKEVWEQVQFEAESRLRELRAGCPLVPSSVRCDVSASALQSIGWKYVSKFGVEHNFDIQVFYAGRPCPNDVFKKLINDVQSLEEKFGRSVSRNEAIKIANEALLSFGAKAVCSNV